MLLVFVQQLWLPARIVIAHRAVWLCMPLPTRLPPAHPSQHEDKGCMKVVRWECPGYNETQPYICRDFQYPVPATYTKGRPFDWANSSAAAPAPAPNSAAPRSSGVAATATAAAMLLLCVAMLG